MKKLLIALFLLNTSLPAFGGTVKVAVLDTGYDFKNFDKKVPICLDSSHSIHDLIPIYKDDEAKKAALHDNMGHGTHVSGLIDKGARYAKYCQVIIKTFNFTKEDKLKGKNGSTDDMVKGIEYAISLGVDVINISAGGYNNNEKETTAIKKALDKGIIIVAAAGNDSVDLSNKCTYFPACADNRIVVVGAIDMNGNLYKKTNKNGPIDVYAEGVKTPSLNGESTGTSMATALISGVIVSELDKERRNPEYRSKIIEEWTSPKKKEDKDGYQSRNWNPSY